MRDRLIELIKQADFDYTAECCEISENGSLPYPPLEERFADHLLANGVIVPPVKVGQTVYRTKGNYFGEEIYVGIVDQIVIHYGGRKAFFYVQGHPLHFTVDNLGVDVFLTREEAENALKGESNELNQTNK